MAVKKGIDVVFYEQTACNAKFIVQLHRVDEDNFKGKCPNPRCGRYVVLRPGERYASIDKARRKYIKLSHRLKNRIFWQIRIT